MKPTAGKILYAAIFCAGVPLLLAGWAAALERKLPALPHLHSVPAGLAFLVTGAVLMTCAMWDLWRRGGGLPMNAYPPARFVSAGVYRWVAHPIYLGFGLAVPGAALMAGSRAGLWLATPITWLAMAALVIGYERIDLQKRFGPSATRPWLSRPPHDARTPSVPERLSAIVLAFTPWLLGYEACVYLGASRHAISTTLPLESNWPVREWTASFYLGAYGWTAAAPLLVTGRANLRIFLRTAWGGTGFIVWCFLALPLVAAQRPFEPTTFWGRWLFADRALDTPACAFPAFHVFWAFAAADLWAGRVGVLASRLIAIAIAASCLTTGAHSLLDVVAGWLVYVGARHCDVLWRAMRERTERIANSWRDWRAGPLRIINHGGYVTAATALGLWLVGLLLGATHTPAIVTVALCSIAGAGFWGQWLEASSQLSRPFGYFGGLFGGCVGTLVAQILWRDGWQVAGAFAVAAPVIQGIGRLRCLVQGCCHGRPTVDWLGIRYSRPLSRVCRLAGLDGVPIHPTPLYSLLGNLAILGLLVRLWIEGADLALIVGAYFILSTCARFMEEGYRGEPQTLRWGGLPIYQWLAMGCLLVGLVFTALPSPLPPVWDGCTFAPLSYALPIGLLVGFCMGVDFPESQRRMSRLA